MTSKKRSAQAKRVAQFKAQLGGLDTSFSNEEHRLADAADKKREALRKKACESKNRYDTEAQACEAIAACAAYGTAGLRCYRCPHCDGWHLTSKATRVD